MSEGVDKSKVQALVSKYVENGKFIEITAALLREKRKEQKELEPAIISAIRADGEEGWDIPGHGEVLIKTRVKRGGLSRKFLEQKLPEILGESNEAAKEHVAELLQKRPEEEVEELKFKMDPGVKAAQLAKVPQ